MSAPTLSDVARACSTAQAYRRAVENGEAICDVSALVDAFETVSEALRVERTIHLDDSLLIAPVIGEIDRPTERISGAFLGALVGGSVTTAAALALRWMS